MSSDTGSETPDLDSDLREDVPTCINRKEHKVWCIGDRCLAPFSGDNEFYPGTINSIKHDKNGKKTAVIKFTGYKSDENEEFSFHQLRQPARKKTTPKKCDKPSSSASDSTSSMFSPLKGSEFIDRLRQKYAELDEEDYENSFSSPASSSSTRDKFTTPSRQRKRRKGIVAIGGETIQSPSQRSYSFAMKKSAMATPPQVESSDVKKDGANYHGFTDSDLERPYFPAICNCKTKEPLILSKSKHSVVQVPATIHQYLRDYQCEGIKFLYSHYKNNSGAILGDDMGLGKTIQVIGLICAILGKTGTREDCQRKMPKFLQKDIEKDDSGLKSVFLIATPKTVLYNWLDEFKTWSYCNVEKYHGKDREATLIKAMKGKLDVILTTHETLRVSVDDLNRVNWSAVFVDEVHKIKEPMAKVTQAFKTLRTKRRYGLTGTILQNNMLELWCVLDWANPGCLGAYVDFDAEFQNTIVRGQRFDASKRELADARKKSNKFSKLRDKWMIRRTKKLIADQLPKKDEKVVFCNLSDFQTTVYKEVLASDDVQLILRQKEDCDCGRFRTRGRCCYKTNADGVEIKSLTFTYKAFLTKVANHVALLIPHEDQSANQVKIAKKICERAFKKYPQFVHLTQSAAFTTLTNTMYCGKMKILEKLLHRFREEGSKILLFSYYTKLLDILEQYIMGTGMEYRRIDGKTPGPVRMNYVHEFNQDKSVSVCLISTKAGGLGLNMTGANIVIIFDPNWNPAHDQQAQDRAYRIGQQRDVKVYRLISSGTIEENMYLRQIYKQQIASTLVSSESSKRYFNAVAGDKSQPGELYGPENVFRFGRGGCLTEDLIAREKTFEQGIMMAPYTSPESHVDEEVENYEENEQEEKNDDCVNSEDDWIRSQISYHSDDSDEVDRHDAGILRTQHMEIKTDEDESDEMMSLDTSNSLDEDAKLNLKSEQMLRHSVRNERYKEALSRKGTLSSSKKGDAHQEENKMKRKVKRNVQFLDVSSEDEEDGIARNVRRKKKKTKAKNNYSSDAEDSMEVILKECGANYIHSNMAVVGGSRVEHHVSKCAIKDVYELEQYSQMPANCHIQTLSQPNSEESDDLGVSCKSSITQSLITEDNTTQSDDPCCLYNPVVLHSKRESRITGNVTLLIGETPKTITRQHFADIAKSLSYKSTLEFAETVLSIDSKERLEILEDYYSKKYAHLQVVDTKGLYTVKVAEEKPKNKQIRVKNVKKNAALRKRPQNTRMRKRRPLAVNFDSDESEEENYRRDKRCMYKNRRKVVYRSDSDEERNDIERKDESSNDGDLEEENVSLKEGALSRRKAGVFQHESGAQNIHDELLCMDSETDGTISVEDSPQPPQVTTIERESSSSISLCKKANMDFLDDIFMCDNNLSDDHSDVNVTQVNRHDDKVTEVTSCSYGDEDSYFVLNKNYRKVIEDL